MGARKRFRRLPFLAPFQGFDSIVRKSQDVASTSIVSDFQSEGSRLVKSVLADGQAMLKILTSFPRSG